MRIPRSLLALTLCAGGLVAQDPAPATPQQAAIRHDATTMFLAAGEHALADVIDAGARFLGGNIVTRPDELRHAGAVVLQSDLTFDRDRAEEVLADLLYARSFVLVPTNREQRLYEAIFASGPRGREIQAHAPHKSVAEILAQPELRMPVTTRYSLQTVHAAIATNALRPFFAAAGGPNQGLTFGTAGDNRTLLLSGMQHSVAAAIELLREVDGGAEAAADEAADGDDTLQQRVAALEQLVQELQATVAKLTKQLADRR